MNKRDKMYQRIEQHGLALNAVFNTGIDPVTLCKKLFRLENKAHQLSTDYCNGVIDDEEWDAKTGQLLALLDKTINFTGHKIPVYVNGDARGYALKIKSEWMAAHNRPLVTDMGGYGLIAPDLTEG